MSKVYINQQDNYQGNFGEVLRSSAIFWVKNSATFKSTISFMNYWKIKRNLNVSVIATVRELDGALIKRERLTFDQGEVINYSNFTGGDFEGSVEIDVYSLENMVIPYSAIMIVYEGEKGISMVHGYTRNYSRYEVEDKKTITKGEEGCWLIKDTKEIQSFGIVHNGAKELFNQNWKIQITNHKGEKISSDIKIDQLKPFETIKLIPADLFKNLLEFLNGYMGSATFSFELGEGFTRMLVGHTSKDGSDIQVTHSNFNYSIHQTNILSDTSAAIMYMPEMQDLKMNVVVYPDAEPGQYHIEKNSGEAVFTSGSLLSWPMNGETRAAFTKVGGGLPSRIVTAIEGNLQGSKTLPFECSLGVITKKRPPKRMWWGLLADNDHLKSRLIAVPMKETYGPIPDDTNIFVALYGPSTHDKMEIVTTWNKLKDIEKGVFFEKLFPELSKVTNNTYAYYTFYSDYAGFWVYSSIENEHKSFTLEHGF